MGLTSQGLEGRGPSRATLGDGGGVRGRQSGGVRGRRKWLAS